MTCRRREKGWRKQEYLRVMRENKERIGRAGGEGKGEKRQTKRGERKEENRNIKQE